MSHETSSNEDMYQSSDTMVVRSGKPQGLALMMGVLNIAMFTVIVGGTLASGHIFQGLWTGVIMSPFGIAGLYLFSSRSGLWIDREFAELVAWSQAFWRPKTVRRTPLAFFNRVEITRVRRRISKTSKIYYVVTLRGSGNEVVGGETLTPERGEFEIGAWHQRQDATVWADKLAAYLKLPVENLVPASGN